MQGPSLFFQIAAGLIPGFLFAGISLDALTPPADWSKKRATVLGAFASMLVFGGVVLYAEVSAIRGALGDELEEYSVWAVVLTVVGGTTFLCALFLKPWFRQSTSGFAVIAVLLTVVAIALALLLRSSIELAASELALGESQRQLGASREGLSDVIALNQRTGGRASRFRSAPSKSISLPSSTSQARARTS